VNDKGYETSGINLSVMKKSPLVTDESFFVTLGNSSRKLRESSYSRDSRDSKKGRGVRLSNDLI
jgi:hypothetical protein